MPYFLSFKPVKPVGTVGRLNFSLVLKCSTFGVIFNANHSYSVVNAQMNTVLLQTVTLKPQGELFYVFVSLLLKHSCYDSQIWATHDRCSFHS